MNEIDDNNKNCSGLEEAHRRPGASAAAASDNRSDISRDELRAIKAEIPDRLPGEQDMETMVLLVDVDPCHAHVYWHVEAAVFERVVPRVSRDRSRVRLTLRIHDALCAGMSGFVPWPPLELEVSGLEGYRYVEIPDCGKDLIAELATHDRVAGEVTLAWSRPVRVDEPGGSPRLVERLSAECFEYLRPGAGKLQAESLPDRAPEAGFSSFATQSWFWSAQLATGRTGGGDD